MPNRDSDPPVSIPPIVNNDLVITAGKGGNREETLTVKTKGKLRLILIREDVRIEMPIDDQNWSLVIE